MDWCNSTEPQTPGVGDGRGRSPEDDAIDLETVVVVAAFAVAFGIYCSEFWCGGKGDCAVVVGSGAV
jgi:hypothetical protein